MINPEDFLVALRKNGVNKFSGVPDSLLKDVCAFISDNTLASDHLISSNEGSAISLAVGQYIASGKPSLVYMQNSGFGNALNPLLSLADTKVYSVPMLLLIGWRGEPGIKDEPQHIKQGEIMQSLLDVCGIPSIIIDADTRDIDDVVTSAIKLAESKKQPVALLARKGTFKAYSIKKITPDISKISRESAIESVIKNSESNDIFVSTTGMASRELYEIRVRNNQSHNNDFLTVGSMGHANMIALGIAQNIKSHVFCIDGDGASLMHLGNLASTGQSKCKNLIHILLNNAAHDSVGGQPTVANKIDMILIAKACGYKSSRSITNLDDIKQIILNLKSSDGPHLIEIKISKGSRGDLGRPASSPIENKEALMQLLKNIK
jgi:phosphonopyruvate decarboxylase